MTQFWKHVFRARWGYIFVSPWVILYAAFGIYPLVLSFYLTFLNYNFVQPESMSFVGLGNWVRVLTDPMFLRSLFNIVYNQAIFIFLSMSIGLGTAVLLKEVRWGARLFRTIYFIPTVVSVVVVMSIGGYIASPQGPVQMSLVKLGIMAEPVFWAFQKWLAMPILALINTWKWFGIQTVILLAGLYSIDPQLYEAASLDGASGWHQFRSITLPQLNPQILFLLVMNVINGLQMFTEPFMVFDLYGGLYHQGLTPVLYIYATAFDRSNMGYASAIGLSLAVIILIATVLQFRFVQRDVE